MWLRANLVSRFFPGRRHHLCAEFLLVLSVSRIVLGIACHPESQLRPPGLATRCTETSAQQSPAPSMPCSAASLCILVVAINQRAFRTTSPTRQGKGTTRTGLQAVDAGTSDSVPTAPAESTAHYGNSRLPRRGSIVPRSSPRAG